jgi:predicted nucleic acid-binding protein
LIAYIDASVLLRIVLGQEDLLGEWPEIERGVTSVLSEVECLRTLDRRRARGLLPAEVYPERRGLVLAFLSRMERVEITRSVLTRAAAPFPTPLGTLDALHLATALAWRATRDQDLVMTTHDVELGVAARAEGFVVLGL